MNAPGGFTLDSNGNVIQVDTIQVIFNKSVPWHTCSSPRTWWADF
jgi:hypothetical protein